VGKTREENEDKDRENKQIGKGYENQEKEEKEKSFVRKGKGVK
jgi:hypothetical protein